MNRKEKNPAGGVLFFWNGVGTGKDIAMNEKNAKNQNQELNQKEDRKSTRLNSSHMA